VTGNAQLVHNGLQDTRFAVTIPRLRLGGLGVASPNDPNDPNDPNGPNDPNDPNGKEHS
jgi:hypothetical protein